MRQTTSPQTPCSISSFNAAGVRTDDGGETVDYTVELMVLDYTIAPYLDTSDL